MSSTIKPYYPPIDLSQYPTFAITLCTIGFSLMAWFLVYETTTSKNNRKLKSELLLATSSSVILGLGLFFLLLWTGVYV